MTPSGPTGFSVPTTGSSKIATTSTSKSAIRKIEGSGKDCRPESSSCRIGICPMKTVMTKSGPQTGRNPQRDGIGLTESPLRNRNRWLKKLGLSQLRKRGDDVHEKANAP